MQKIETIRTIGVAGSGTMGASIALIFARRGYRVHLYNRSGKGLERAFKLIELNQEELVRSGKTTKAQAEETAGRISRGTDLPGLADADFLIETIVEDPAVKKTFLAELSALADENTVIATNTSGLSITELGEAVRNPRRFAGMHWINPPHLVPLIEVISGADTASETADIICALAEKIGKKPVRVKKDVPGFMINRLQFAMLREALYIVENGIADPEDVDNAIKFGLGLRYAALGPFETADLGGLDTFCKIGDYLFADLSDKNSVPELMARLCSEGAYGVKSGRGFYDYSGDKAAEAVRRRDEIFLKLLNCLYPDR